MQRHFQVSPPSVHQMVLTLERADLIRRIPGVPRSIELLIESEAASNRQNLSATELAACRT
jgi:Mn-dependent DtxR family transcriptional regulator